MPEVATISHPTLTLIANLFEAFHENDIRYCHWKGHDAHLVASLTGASDLDILFDFNEKKEIESLLNNLGFKKFLSIKQKQLQGVEDFLAMDIPSGKLIHLHAHFRLPMGRPYLKEFPLDLEKKILDSRVFNNTYGTFCIHPAVQFVNLFLIESLKLTNRDALRILVGSKVKCSEKIINEYRWLRANVSDDEVRTALQSIFPDPEPFEEIIKNDLDYQQLLQFARLARAELAEKQSHSAIEGLLLRWYREAFVLVNKKLSRFWPVAARRINPRGGLTVAFIGADGSGKSTAVAAIKKTFEEKLDVQAIYFGRGDGDISWVRKQMQSLKEKLYSRKTDKSLKYESVHSSSHGGLMTTLYKCVNALLVAREKNRNMDRMLAARKEGMLVICDRYPQNQIMGFNDGPLLSSFRNSTNPLFKFCARQESKTYARAQETPPDLVFKLIADASIVESRKPGETSLKKLEAKISGIKQVQFGDACKVVTVDTSRPLSEVLSTIKSEIWKAM